MKKRTTKSRKQIAKSPRTKRSNAPTDYVEVLADVKRLIADSRHRALATVNRELVCVYGHIGQVIVQQRFFYIATSARERWSVWQSLPGGTTPGCGRRLKTRFSVYDTPPRACRASN